MSKRKHILFLSSWYPNKEHPTNGNFVKRHAQSVSLLNDVTVIHVASSQKVNATEVETFNTSPPFKEILIYIPEKKNLLSKYLAFKTAYSKAIQQLDKVDLVHLNVIVPLAHIVCPIINKLGIPFIITEHSTIYLDADSRSFSFIDKIQIQKTLNKASFVCPVSKDLGEKIKEDYGCRNIEVVPNVVDESIFKFNDKNNSSVKKILHVSSYNDEQKNISGLLRVTKQLFAQRKDIKLILIGDGDINVPLNIKAELDIEDDCIEIHGRKTSKEIANYFNQSDVFVLFSNYENSPCVISEALMCGVPVIATNVGGIKEMINDDSGRIVEAQDEKQLLKTLQNTLDDLSVFDRKKISEGAFNTYSKQVIAKKFNEIYNLCLKTT